MRSFPSEESIGAVEPDLCALRPPGTLLRKSGPGAAGRGPESRYRVRPAVVMGAVDQLDVRHRHQSRAHCWPTRSPRPARECRRARSCRVRPRYGTIVGSERRVGVTAVSVGPAPSPTGNADTTTMSMDDRPDCRPEFRWVFGGKLEIPSKKVEALTAFTLVRASFLSGWPDSA